MISLEQERNRYVPLISEKNKYLRAKQQSMDLSEHYVSIPSTGGENIPMSTDNYVTLNNVQSLDPEDQLLQSEFEKVAMFRRGGPTSGIYNKRLLFDKTGKTVLHHDKLPPQLSKANALPGQDSIMLQYDRANMWSAQTGDREN